MRTIKESFRAGFFGTLGIITAITACWLVIFLAQFGFCFIQTIASRLPSLTPEAALDRYVDSNITATTKEYKILATRKLLNNSVNKELIVFCPENVERTYMQKCIEREPFTTRYCVVATQKLGGWEVTNSNTDSRCDSMMETGKEKS